MAGAVVISAEEWDTRWYSIYDDARADGCSIEKAQTIADCDTAEQFGDRPQDTKEAAK